jgi:anti-sigma B factor antagonist
MPVNYLPPNRVLEMKFSCRAEDTRRGPESTEKLVLSGDLDASGGALLSRRVLALVDAGRIDLTINLDAIGFLDSSGLAALISSLRIARERGGDVRIESSNARIRRILEVTSLSRVFKMRPQAKAA